MEETHKETLIVQGDAGRLPFPGQSVDLVFGSPPYTEARLYLEQGRDLKIARKTHDWIVWMLAVTAEALRVSRGAVLWVVAGATRNRTYEPSVEGLLYEWWKAGGSCYRPCYWHRVSISGSGGDQWFRADVATVLCFKRPGKLPWSDNTACGHPPKWAPGGEMSHRLKDGTRHNQQGRHTAEPTPHTDRRQEWGGGQQSSFRKKNGTRDLRLRSTKRRANGAMERQTDRPPVLANPGNLIHASGGGGHLGSKLAHENEAPFPESLPAFFIRSLCPPNGLVLDPFGGSGTTVAAARAHGRRGRSLDGRPSQAALATRRLREPPGKVRAARAAPPPSVSGQLNLFPEEGIFD